MSDSGSSPAKSAFPLTPAGKYVIIACAFLGWFFGGTHMAINGLAMRTAALNLLYISGGDKLTTADKEAVSEFRKTLDLDGECC